VEIIQNRETVALASVVTALRRPSWSHQAVRAPQAPPFASVKPLPRSAFAMAWTRQYDFRFIEGAPNLSGTPHQEPADARSTMWLGDTRPRIIDFPSLMSMSDAFFGRIFLARGEIVPFGTVSITTYFHVGADELAHEAATRVLASADGKVFHRSYGDQTGELWAESGKLLATTQQIAYFKA
jgi:hypothetical protein